MAGDSKQVVGDSTSSVNISSESMLSDVDIYCQAGSY